MFDVDSLLRLGLLNQMIPLWQVMIYILSLLPFMLRNRIRLCLLVTYLFTFYLGFMVQWGEYLASSGSLLPFTLYAFSGMTVTVAFVMFVFQDEGMQVNIRWRRQNLGLYTYNSEEEI